MDIPPPTHWSRFWRQGHITTFGAALKDNYEGVIKNFWLEQFQTLPSAAALLDIATGNGALALLAAHYADDHQLDWRINASDLAEINRTGDEHPRIEFHPGVPCEALPFNDNRFDLISSQFGFEYSDKAASLAEIYRTLKPGGRFAAICHHRDSYTLQESRKEMAIYHQGLEKNNIFLAAIAYYQSEAEGAADTAEKQKGVNYAVNRLRQGNAGNPCCDQMVGAISHALRNAGTRAQQETIAELVSMNDEFTGAYQRLQDLASAALSAEEMQGLVLLCRNAGFTGVDLGQVFHAPGQLAGFSLVATR